ncbi:pilus assembly protein PilV [Salmonella enterica subsp. enterica serovar Typhimurium]|nr:pilus assembly protein PilV [Salmonella enterica subsp. enterica serovar Typhimurium]
MSTDWQKILLAAVFADHLLYDQLSPYYQNCFYAKYRIGGTGLARLQRMIVGIIFCLF